MGSWRAPTALLLAVWAGIEPVASGLAQLPLGKNAPEHHQHQIQHGPCTYTFLLPEVRGCEAPAAEFQVSNSLRENTPHPAEAKWSTKRLQQLETLLENNTQWLQKVLNQTSRMEIQMLENSLSTHRLEKQLLLQMQEIRSLQERNSFLEKKILAMGEEREEDLQNIQTEKVEMQRLLAQQIDFIKDLEQQLGIAVVNNTALQKQQASLAEIVTHLMSLVIQSNQVSFIPLEEQKTFKDCAAAYKSGFTGSGIYTLKFPNTTATAKVFCDMESSGGGWTVIQHRQDGSVDFQRIWKEYKQTDRTFCGWNIKSFSLDLFQGRTFFYNVNLPALRDLSEQPCGRFRYQRRLEGQQFSGSCETPFHWRYRLHTPFISFGIHGIHHPSDLCALQGFGTPPGEYWLGNEFIHLLTAQNPCSLHIKLRDWENHEAYSLYEYFQLGPEEQNYQLHARGYSGTAGRMSSLSPSGTDFSTKDVDNDHCACNCAQMAGGGWWYEACGPSNLNGVYYFPSPPRSRYNSMKWHYWKGPNHSLQMTTMMIRPVDFLEQ